MTGIVSWGIYVPKFRIKIEDIAKAHGSNPEEIKKSLMISEKSLPGPDEDTVTIAVEASRNALIINPRNIGALYIGSESHPYAVKPTGTIVAESLEIGNDYTTADFEFACKAGTAAMQVAIALVKSGMVKNALIGGCDTAQAAPGDPLEYTAAAGGAVFIIGNDNVVAQINHTLSYTSDTPDFWRRNKEKYPSHGGSFTGEPAYYRHVTKATENLMNKMDTQPEDYDYAVFHQPNGKFPTRVAKRLGFTKEQILPGLIVTKIGNTYSGSSLLGLAAVLDIAEPGQRILLTSYGSGAGSDSFDITITDEIKKVRSKLKSVNSYIENKSYVNYSTYLKHIGALK